MSNGARDMRNVNDLFYMWETDEFLKGSIVNIMRSSRSQINGINLDKLKFHFLLQAIVTRLEIKAFVWFSYHAFH